MSSATAWAGLIEVTSGSKLEYTMEENGREKQLFMADSSSTQGRDMVLGDT